jgi:hypothetical protein
MILMQKELEELLVLYEKHDVKFKLIIDEKQFDVKSVNVKNEITPVTKPTKRGGVYFSDTTISKVNVKINDLAITKHLTKAMLGPNTEFQDIILRVTYNKKNIEHNMNIITNLTSSMQSSNEIELNLIIQNIVAE